MKVWGDNFAGKVKACLNAYKAAQAKARKLTGGCGRNRREGYNLPQI